MKLIFDLTKTQPLGSSKFHGGGKYGEVVFEKLVERSHDIIAYYNPNKWINPRIKAICIDHNILLIDANSLTLSQAAAQFGGFIYSPLIGKEVSFLNDNVLYIATLHGLRSLEMVYDNYKGVLKSNMLGWLYSFYYSINKGREFRNELQKHRKLFVRKNIKLITVSQHSQSSILSFFPNMEAKDIRVFYSPSTLNLLNERSSVANGNDKYYYIVSGERWIKNAIRAVKALDELFTERSEIKGKVIVSGVNDSRVFQKFIKNPSRFQFKGYVDEETLFSLYKGAYLFIYPSLNEGFGYPPLEAMANGTPVIASAISSIPEICGDSVLYFNPMLISEIKNRILQMENPTLRSHYIEKAGVQFSIIKQKQDEDLEKLADYLLSFVK